MTFYQVKRSRGGPAWQQVGWRLEISTKQAYGYLQTRLNTQNQQGTISRLQTAVQQGREYAVHVMAITAIAGLVVVGSIGGGDKNSNDTAAKLLAQGNGYHAVVDETASAYVAANVAGDLSMSLSSQVSQDAENLSQQRQFVAASDNYLSKSSTIATDSKTSDDIQTYTVKSGESISDIAKRFGITTDTIRWANELDEGTQVSTGDKLTILPVNGVLHTISEGDNAKSLAAHYEANAAQIISFNDAEVSGLKKGQKIIIPDGRVSIPQQPEPVFGGGFASSFTPSFSPGNSYAWGYCTWHAKNKRPDIPNGWGNAISWYWNAKSSGHPTGSTPRVGAVAQDKGIGGLGHVSYVEKVNPNGTVTVSEMNYGAPLGIATTRTAPASSFYYIY